MELKEFIKNFANQFDDTEVEAFTPDCNFKELDEWGSLTSLAIIAMVRTEYGKKIVASEIRHCETIEDLYNLVHSK